MGKQLYNYTNLLNNFSKNMKKRRLELNLSQKQLADIVYKQENSTSWDIRQNRTQHYVWIYFGRLKYH